MVRYRIYSKNILCEGMTESEALETVLQLKDSQPSEIFEVEEYNQNSQKGRLGRDPDLH